MNLNDLPPIFADRMRLQLGSSSQAYFDAMQAAPVRGIRMNPLKPVSKEAVNGLGASVPWNPLNGYYLSAESDAGATPLHECGAWYLQEPSAMAPVAVLNPQPGETILDLCAAPGGKSTQIGERMHGEGLLVCNEPVPSRAKILSRNIERMGISNSLVVSADPSVLCKKWPETFTAVLVDAPCSGEGMFRRHPETCAEWTPESAMQCAARQARILDAAAQMVLPGGRMVYSTCTHNLTEDDETVAAFLERHADWRAVSFSLPIGEKTQEAPSGIMHLYPHEAACEGHFIAFLQKEGALPKEAPLEEASKQLAAPQKPLLTGYRVFAGEFGEVPLPNAMMGDTALSVSKLPPIKGLTVLRAGIQLGAMKGKVFIPDHALALALPTDAKVQRYSVTQKQAAQYQRGEVLAVPEALKGFLLPCLQGLPLGFGKAVEGQLKNHYPKGLRRP